MKTSVKRSLACMLAIMLTIFCFMSMYVSAEGEDETSNGSMNLDIVFVLDASGSMLRSDPNRIALDAFSLFVDMCDDTCRVGYDVYTHTLKESEPIRSIKDSASLEQMKNKFKNIVYEPNGDTDIALGLTQAKKLFEDNEGNPNRKQAIVLLSDGNTDLPKGPRSVAESEAEMKSTLEALASRYIQVYSIGLNSDGSLDKKELDNISAATGGRSYEINGSEKLTSIISDIFANISDMNGTDRPIKDGKVDIEVKDSNVLYVNVIVRTKLTREEMNPVLFSPDGAVVSLDDNPDVRVTSTKSYMLVKIYYPDIGKWTLQLQKADNANSNVKQLNYYSVFINQSVPEKAAVNQPMVIEATISDNYGLIKDTELLATIKMVGTVTSKNGTETFELNKTGSGTYRGTFEPDEVGDYTIVTKAVSDRFGKESPRASVEVLSSLEGEDPIQAAFAFIREHLSTILSGIAALVIVVVIIVLVKK